MTNPGGRRASPDSPSAETRRLPARPPCPFCDGEDTELVSTFGSHASVATYWCRRCRSPFEMLKWRAPEGGAEGDA